MRTLACVCVMFCVLAVVFLFAATVPAVKAVDMIYIRPDGSIEPSTANITSADGITYAFTGNNYLPIRVERGNITLDGKGYTLQISTTEVGIEVDRYSEQGPEIIGMGNVTIQNLRIKGCYWAIHLDRADGNRVVDNVLTENTWAMYVDYSGRNLIAGNIITNNSHGIYLRGTNQTGYNEVATNEIVANLQGAVRIDSSSNTSIHDNNILDNAVNSAGWSIWISGESGDNVFYRNNIICEVGVLVSIEAPASANRWDDGSAGNFWGNYAGQDLNGDGVGDTAHNVSTPYDSGNLDHYPLMNRAVIQRTYAVYATPVSLASSSIVSDFEFDGDAKTISFTVAGVAGTSGSCTITFLNDVLGGPYTVLVDGTPITPVITSNATHMTLELTYTHSTHLVEVIGTTAIPEVATPFAAILLWAMLTATLLLIRRTKRTIPSR